MILWVTTGQPASSSKPRASGDDPIVVLEVAPDHE